MLLSLFLAALQEPALGGKGAALQQAWIESRVHAAAARALPANRAEAEARKTAGRAHLLRGLGLDPLPERTPLQARVTGVLDRDGYRIEKIAFQSRPDFWVTAHLYVPDGDGPFPVILNPHGHWGWKKTEPVVQARLIAQARHGYLALIVDSPGHSFEGGRPVERRQQGTHDEWRLSMSVGTATGVYVWDLMRALDYLEARPEADVTRVGVTGASGGGTATTYFFAADERLDCAVPVVYATSLEINPHNGCLCNHVPGTLRIGDRADVLALRAPAPVLVIGARDDGEFPPAGTELTGTKLRAIGDLYGAGDAARWLLFDGPHDYNRPMREAAMGFFDLHLRGRGDGTPVAEPEAPTAPPDAAELVVLPEWPADSRTMLDLARERLAAAAEPERTDLQWLLMSVGSRDERVESVHAADGIETLVLRATGMIPLPALLARAAEPARGLLLLFHDEGKERAFVRFDARGLAARGFHSLALDVPGTGELAGPDQRLLAYLGCGAVQLAGAHLTRVPEFRRAFGAEWVPLPMAVLGDGPFVTAMMLDPGLRATLRLQSFIALNGLEARSDVFERATTALCAQPLAVNLESLAQMRERSVAKGLWHFRGADEPDWLAYLLADFTAD
jgi:dienelactone hydrolase